ncbi:O-Glycosyl hydrolases family 17 protein [Actinidia rufa]|uniref:O-Glycosyl hydrolases family 17 protein n=1 Tax=Actinidia rufa TaxID=165716 RepID=A0A7J0ERK6_9ERIC|nr:O-Glycosyl hydrolases family 17 protein [Actinidia rufa]
MAEVASNCLFLCLLFVLTLCSSGTMVVFAEMAQPKEFELKREQEQMFHLHNFHYKATQHDTIYPPTTTFPTTPVTIPPDNNPTPTIVTVPSTNPASTPLTVPSTNPAPITNPVTTPGAVPGTQPITNPVTTYPAPSTGIPVTTPVTNPVAPPAMTGSPAVPGQSWCVARSGSPEASLQSALDYACGIGGADCSVIQQGASCYNPNTMENHASYAFNSYYQKNPVQTSCDFGGTAIITNMNPSKS